MPVERRAHFFFCPRRWLPSIHDAGAGLLADADAMPLMPILFLLSVAAVFVDIYCFEICLFHAAIDIINTALFFIS